MNKNFALPSPQDIERNDGTPEKPYYMSTDLKKILGYLNDKEEEDERRLRQLDGGNNSSENGSPAASSKLE